MIGTIIKFVKYENDGEHESTIKGVKLIAELLGMMLIS